MNTILKIKNKTKSSHALNPHKHWIDLLFIFGVIIAFLIIFSLYLLYQIKNDQIFQANPSVTEGDTLIKDKLLKNVTSIYTDKAQKEEAIKSAPANSPDPSL